MGIVGIFIPLTPEDIAIEAGIWAATTPAAGAVIGRVTSVFRGLSDLFLIVRGGNRTQIGDLIGQGATGTSRADDIKKAAYFRDYPGLSDLNYADLVRFESKLGADGLQKLEADFVNTPGLAAAFRNDPASG